MCLTLAGVSIGMGSWIQHVWLWLFTTSCTFIIFTDFCTPSSLGPGSLTSFQILILSFYPTIQHRRKKEVVVRFALLCLLLWILLLRSLLRIHAQQASIHYIFSHICPLRISALVASIAYLNESDLVASKVLLICAVCFLCERCVVEQFVLVED